MSNKARDAIVRARVQGIRKHPFLGTMALHLELQECESIPTVATDMEYLFYNPDFVLSLSGNELIAAIAHEVWHVVFMDPLRRGTRIHKIWNMAGDYRINAMLKKDNYQLGKDWLLDNKYDMSWSADEIYLDLLKNMPPPEKQNKCCGGMLVPGHGHGKPNGQAKARADGKSAEQIAKELENKIKGKLASTANICKGLGQLPGDLATLIDSLLYQPLDWRTIVRQWAEEITKSDFSWLQPNPRYTSYGLYLPTLSQKQIKPFGVAIDTSGSMSNEDMAVAVGSISDILEDIKPPQITVMQCDAKLHSVVDYCPADLPLGKVTVHGRGGTSVHPVFEHIEKQALEFAGLIYLTDLEVGNQWPKDPGFPVVWVHRKEHRSRSVPPFGTVVEMA